ncbi:cytochrome P450 [Streptomonospora wellingtoniae]|uniref:Cytochrome P450 n=1 Tax=Streptomonospora wellingtoniae TaxID=3075544 RepID=A0ABU2KTM2_9ACTN|nr:cytochrome P450 [Streptomonospora sp. DSM 45055]MDT0302488.1 cytochrome P450 [Streptomonospora sp. DSM 45055]
MAEVDLAGVRALAVTRHEALRSVLADRSGTFVRGGARQNWRALREGRVAPDSALALLVGGSVGSLLTSNGAEHARLRKPMQTHFTRRRVEALRPRVEKLADDLLTQMDGAESADVKDRFAWPLTVGVLVGLLGVDEEDAPVLGDIARRVFELSDPGVYAEANGFLRDLVAKRRAAPGDDLVSALAAADDATAEADRLGDARIAANLVLLVIAGFETTMGTLANGVRALLTHPDQLERVTGGEVEWATAVEEILRRHTSVSLLPAVFATRDTEVAGVPVPEGEMVLLAYAAAALDPAAWESPDEFDVGRDARGHLSFGHGPHLCLGAPLARLELNVALPRLFRRFPDLALDNAHGPGSAVPVESWMMTHPRQLWVRPHGTGAHPAPEPR